MSKVILNREEFVAMAGDNELAQVINGIIYDMVYREVAPEGEEIAKIVDARMKLWPDAIQESLLCYIEELLDSRVIVDDEEVVDYMTETMSLSPEFCAMDIVFTCIAEYRELIKIQADVINVLQKAMHEAETKLANLDDGDMKMQEFNQLAETIWREENEIPDEAG